jgi:hypothetical protein
MRRRTLDIIVSTGGLALAVLLVVVGIVLTDNARFSEGYVGDQLAQEKITFKEAAELTPEEQAFTEANSGCLITFAGQDLTTGKQAECYANEYIGAHLTYYPTMTGMTAVAYADGMTFRELGGVQRELRTKIEEATAANDPALPALEQELADITTVRGKIFEGQMLRNALLTSYGFSVLGEKAAEAARFVFIGAVLLALLAIAGFVHALLTPKTRAFAPVLPEQPPIRRETPSDKELAGV